MADATPVTPKDKDKAPAKSPKEVKPVVAEKKAEKLTSHDAYRTDN